jgi:hypothetical protein
VHPALPPGLAFLGILAVPEVPLGLVALRSRKEKPKAKWPLNLQTLSYAAPLTCRAIVPSPSHIRQSQGLSVSDARHKILAMEVRLVGTKSLCPSIR